MSLVALLIRGQHGDKIEMKHGPAALLIASVVSTWGSVVDVSAQNAYSGQDSSQLSREEWRSRVDAARRNVQSMRRQGKSFIAPAPSVTELEEELSRRIMEDQTLRAGDIISTTRGLFLFKGQHLHGKNNDAFVPLETHRPVLRK